MRTGAGMTVVIRDSLLELDRQHLPRPQRSAGVDRRQLEDCERSHRSLSFISSATRSFFRLADKLTFTPMP